MTLREEFENEVRSKTDNKLKILFESNDKNYIQWLENKMRKDSWDSWLSPIDTERKWQEDHIKKIWEGYPHICPKWQILNGLIINSCENNDIKIDKG